MNFSTNLGGRKVPALAQEDMSPGCTSSEIFLRLYSDVGICLRLYPDSRTRKIIENIITISKLAYDSSLGY